MQAALDVVLMHRLRDLPGAHFSFLEVNKSPADN
jgi:hypothetical protein